MGLFLRFSIQAVEARWESKNRQVLEVVLENFRILLDYLALFCQNALKRSAVPRSGCR